MAVSSTSDKNEQSDDAQQDLRLTRVAGSTSSAGIGRVIHLFWREMDLLGLSDLSTGTTASAIDISWADAAKKSKFKMTKCGAEEAWQRYSRGETVATCH